MKANILIVDDHPVFRHGLVSLIASEKTHQVVGQAGTMGEAVAVLAQQVPDLMLMDLSLGGEHSGLDLLEFVVKAYPDVLVLVVSIHSEAVYAEKVRLAGARGYVAKQSTSPELKAAIRAVLAGETVFPSRRHSSEVTPPPSASAVDTLSPREREVLEWLGKGLGVSEIAGLLHLSVKTIGIHQDHIKTKLGIGNNYELRRFAIEWKSCE